jgi:hypothetical protein
MSGRGYGEFYQEAFLAQRFWDSLLPQLLSVEIRIKDAESFAQEVLP